MLFHGFPLVFSGCSHVFPIFMAMGFPHFQTISDPTTVPGFFLDATRLALVGGRRHKKADGSIALTNNLEKSGDLHENAGLNPLVFSYQKSRTGKIHHAIND